MPPRRLKRPRSESENSDTEFQRERSGQSSRSGAEQGNGEMEQEQEQQQNTPGRPSARRSSSRRPEEDAREPNELEEEEEEAMDDDADDGQGINPLWVRRILSRLMARQAGGTAGVNQVLEAGDDDDDDEEEDDDEEMDEDWEDAESGEEEEDDDDEEEEEEEEDQGEYDELEGIDEDDDDEEEDDEEDGEEGMTPFSFYRRLMQPRERPEEKWMQFPRYRTRSEANKLGLNQFVGNWTVQSTIISTRNRSDSANYSSRTGSISITSTSNNSLSGKLEVSDSLPVPNPRSISSTTSLSNFSYDPTLACAKFSWSYKQHPQDPRALQKTIYDKEWAPQHAKAEKAIERGVGLAWLCKPKLVSKPCLLLVMETGTPTEEEIPLKEAGKESLEYGVEKGWGVGKLARSEGLGRLALRLSVLATGP